MPQVDARTFIDALHRLEGERDLDTIAGLYAEDANIANPVVAHKHEGPGGARAFWEAYRKTFGEIRSEFHHVMEEDGAAMLEWTSTGTAADGKSFRYRGVSVLEFDGGGIHRFRAYFDPKELGDQLTDP